MKSRFRLFRGKSGNYFCEDRQTGKQESLRTKDKGEAGRLLGAKNEAERDPGLALEIARAYMAHADPAMSTRTWRYAVDELIKTKHGENALRWQRATKDRALSGLWDLVIVETRASHFLNALNKGTVSTNVFLRRLHNFAVDMGWRPIPVLPPKQWPEVRHQPKRAITLEEHQKIIAREQNEERRTFYELLWELGGAQGDVAKLCAEDVDYLSGETPYQDRSRFLYQFSCCSTSKCPWLTALRC